MTCLFFNLIPNPLVWFVSLFLQQHRLHTKLSNQNPTGNLWDFKLTGENTLGFLRKRGRGDAIAQRATRGEEVLGSIPALAARYLQVGSVSV